MEITNTEKIIIDGDVGFPMEHLKKSDISMTPYWVTVKHQDEIIFVPRERIKCITILKNKKTKIKD